jgi:hypothetical protein
MSDVTRFLSAVGHGDPRAAEQPLPLGYDDRRRLAAQKMAHETPGQTIQATAPVRDAYLRLVGGDRGAPWNGRGRFFAPDAEALRRILVEHVRRQAVASSRRHRP